MTRTTSFGSWPLPGTITPSGSWPADCRTGHSPARGCRTGPRWRRRSEVIGPLADAGDDVAELWLACWLADCDHLAELRERADSGSYHASRKLARRLADHDMFDELRARAERGDYHAHLTLIKTLAERDPLIRRS
jgi:hypothetical protein